MRRASAIVRDVTIACMLSDSFLATRKLGASLVVNFTFLGFNRDRLLIFSFTLFRLIIISIF